MARSQQMPNGRAEGLGFPIADPGLSAQRDDGAADVDLGKIHRHLGFHMRRAQTAIKRGFLGATRDFNLTQSQFGTLALLRDSPGATQTFVASELGTDRATVMAIVDRLEERDLLVRKRSVIDRRRKDISLTPAGEAVLRQVMLAIERHEENYVARFTPAERAMLIALVQRVYDRPEADVGD